MRQRCDVRESLTLALGAQVTVVESITPEQLRLPTPCEDWIVLDVLNHSTSVTAKFSAFAAGATDRPRTPQGDLLGDNFKDSVRLHAEEAARRWRAADMSRLCYLPFGTFDAETAAGINLFDVLAHTWDIAVAVNQRFDCGNELWAVGLDAARRVIGPARDAKHYGPEIPVPASAPARRQFLAFLGRNDPPTIRDPGEQP